MKVCALCNYVVTGVHTSGLTNQHKPLRKEEEGKEGPLLMVSGQCGGRQLLRYAAIVVCEENCKGEDSGQKKDGTLSEACFGIDSQLSVLFTFLWF